MVGTSVLGLEMNEAATNGPRTEEEAVARIRELADRRAVGVGEPGDLDRALKLAEAFEIDPDWVREGFAKAEDKGKALEPKKSSFKLGQTKAKPTEEVKPPEPIEDEVDLDDYEDPDEENEEPADELTPEEEAEVQALEAKLGPMKLLAPLPEATPSVPAVVAKPGFDLPIEATAAVQVELLNGKYAVIRNYGGKCVVLSWEPWEINARVKVPRFVSLGDFKASYSNRFVLVDTGNGVRKVPAGEYWLKAP